MRLHVLVNGSAGSVVDQEQTVDAIAVAFRKAGVDIDGELTVQVAVVDAARLGEAAEAAWDDGVDVVVVAGGDGSVNTVASVAVGSDRVMSVLPLGTFNHFAGDLGIADDLEEAARDIVTGEVRSVDVGEVNGQVFVNNSVLGVYPVMVTLRDEIQKRTGWGKVRAVPVASARVLKDLPLHRLDLAGSDGYRRNRMRTPFVFVGNGVYDNAEGGPMVRGDIDDGLLGLSVARVVSRWGLVRAALAALFRGAGQVSELDHVSLSELTVRGRSRQVRVARDGEVLKLDLPLRFRCRSADLKVLAPVRSSGSASPR